VILIGTSLLKTTIVEYNPVFHDTASSLIHDAVVII